MKTVVILAQGDFPTSERCLQMMWEADVLLCCDGAAAKAVVNGFEPDEIVGDLDSLDADFRERYASRLFHGRYHCTRTGLSFSGPPAAAKTIPWATSRCWRTTRPPWRRTESTATSRCGPIMVILR